MTGSESHTPISYNRLNSSSSLMIKVATPSHLLRYVIGLCAKKPYKFVDSFMLLQAKLENDIV